MQKVLILYKFLPQYRVDFFNRLKDELLAENVELELIYGKLSNTDALKNDEATVSWGRFVANKTFRIGKTELLWQPCIKYFKDKDLIITEQANKLLINYYLMVTRYFFKYKFAFWGHGRNMQEQLYSTKNKFKYYFLKKCDWWFAYTDGVKQFLLDQKYPAHKITTVQNAIDTITLKEQYAAVSEEQVAELKDKLGIKGDKTAIFCGGMYPEKRLDFILEAIRKIKLSIPEFHAIFVGSGVDSVIVENAARDNNWIHYVGPQFGIDRVMYFKISSVQLMPGLVGLGILDSFALETPIITTEYPFHSPEIEYLENNINGMITENTLNAYSQVIIDLLSGNKYMQLIDGCKKSAEVYTVEKMVSNFKDGILKCLEISR